MRRVYFVFFMRQVLQPVTLELALLAALIGMLAFFVSLPHVFSNASTAHTLNQFVHFILSAFSHTEGVVKAITISVCLVAVAFIVDTARRLRRVIVYRV